MKEIKWDYKIGEHLIDYKEDGSIKRDFTIIDRKINCKQLKNRKNTRKMYKYHCNICGWDDGWMLAGNMTKKQGCSCCKGLTVVKGINDTATTHPFLIQYFKNKEDAYLYTAHSNKEAWFKCPDCGFEKYIKINNLAFRGFSCLKCSDGISFPEKFMSNVLEQLCIDYIPQLSNRHFSWCKTYRYDFYFKHNSKEVIIEMNGLQHYAESGFHLKGRSLEQEKENDLLKKKIAEENGINTYLIIDSKESTMEYLKKNITDTLSEIFELKNIDWIQANSYACSSLCKRVCDYYHQHLNLSTSDLMKYFKLGKTTIHRYLLRGTENGWCNYNGEEIRKQTLINNKGNRGRQVLVYYNKDFIGKFNSPHAIEVISEKQFGTKLYAKSIRKSCVSKKTYKGFSFIYAD